MYYLKKIPSKSETRFSVFIYCCFYYKDNHTVHVAPPWTHHRWLYSSSFEFTELNILFLLNTTKMSNVQCYCSTSMWCVVFILSWCLCLCVCLFSQVLWSQRSPSPTSLSRSFSSTAACLWKQRWGTDWTLNTPLMHSGDVCVVGFILRLSL